MNNPRTLTAWTYYDWANSAHALVIVSSIFPVYFSAVALNDAGGPVIDFLGISIKNSVLFSYTISAAFLLTALLSPICTAIADYSGRKKAFMKAFCYLGAISCSLLFFFTRETTTFGVICFWLSLIGWSGSIVFYNSYLPDIATEDQYDRVSARGLAMGYVGSVLLMVLNLLVILKRDWFGNISEGLASRIAFLTVGIWWIGFAQIPFNRLPDGIRNVRKDHSDSVRSGYLLNGFRELRKVFGELRTRPLTQRFLLAFFVYNMGVQTVMYVAALFGSVELKMAGDNLIVLILLLQLVAIPGAYGFSWLSGRIGNIYALMVSIFIWIGICAGAYVVQTETQFFMLASVVGLVMGGIQSLSRSTYAKLIPANTSDAASYFSFYDVMDKFSIVLGTLLYGLIEQLTGSMRNSVLALLVLFVAGLAMLARIPSQKIYATPLPEAELS